MKTPEEIKVRLEWLAHPCSEATYSCHECRYNDICDNTYSCDVSKEALSLIAQLEEAAPRWISVDERLPENEERVLITEWHDGFYGKPWCVVMTAFHTDGKTLAEDSEYNWSEGSVEMRYDEDADDYVVPEGWWEDVQCGDEFSMVNAKVTHWMPLPEPPKEV